MVVLSPNLCFRWWAVFVPNHGDCSTFGNKYVATIQIQRDANSMSLVRVRVQ